MSSQSVNDEMVKRGREAGLSSLSPHNLRRTYTSNLLDATGDLSAVQKFLGHSKLETTQVDDESTTEMIKESYRRTLSE